MKYEAIIRHPFDVVCGEPAAEVHLREIFKRICYFHDWCEENTTADYQINNKFQVDGIHVDFESREDCANFQIYAGAFWIWLHE